jgi:NAD(P)-dependent dehydrogenase (short-subunit alcohol dehydrogenase family)
MADRAALVTGASSGIGRACATHLASRGFAVLAGVRNVADAPPNTEPIRLDVTRAEDIAAAAERVGTSLHALVNNAGIAVNGPIEVVPVEDWRHQLEVNLVGQVAVTRALLPALLNARGRIVNMSSISGRNALPLLGPYAASKFALEAFNDSLRREVGPHGVKVACVEPGIIVTPVWAKSRATGEGLVDTMPADARRRYETMLNAVRGFAERAERDGLPPEAVAEVVGHAVTARRPRTRYVVGREARVRVALGRLLPDRAMDALIRRVITTSGGRSGGRG